jgi:DNA-binding MarR family transcriptional regulator
MCPSPTVRTSSEATPRTVAGADASAFAAALDAFTRASRRARARLRPEEGPLSISQYHLVKLLLDADAPRGAGELALAAGVSPPTATRMLDALERSGLVCRARAEHDRRCVHVELTAAGVEAAAAKRRRIDARRQEIFGALSPAERAGATQLLERLAVAVEDLR